jgi:hypothetical protein
MQRHSKSGMDERKVKKKETKQRAKKWWGGGIPEEGGRQRQGGVPNPNDRSHARSESMPTGNGAPNQIMRPNGTKFWGKDKPNQIQHKAAGALLLLLPG